MNDPVWRHKQTILSVYLLSIKLDVLLPKDRGGQYLCLSPAITPGEKVHEDKSTSKTSSVDWSTVYFSLFLRSNNRPPLVGKLPSRVGRESWVSVRWLIRCQIFLRGGKILDPSMDRWTLSDQLSPLSLNEEKLFNGFTISLNVPLKLHCKS